MSQSMELDRAARGRSNCWSLSQEKENTSSLEVKKVLTEGINTSAGGERVIESELSKAVQRGRERKTKVSR